MVDVVVEEGSGRLEDGVEESSGRLFAISLTKSTESQVLITLR